ncbi:MAG: hypothetical protein ACI9E1_000916, partial [Cryomorphaceae bacterium]
EINTAETGIFINDGKGRFRFSFSPLPHLAQIAQIAPTMGIAATHLNANGIPDLVLAQNFFQPQRETGRMDGSLSFVLLGNGDASFRILAPTESGVALPGDARSLTVFDYFGSNRPDLLIARNSATPHLHFNKAQGRFLKMRLVTAHPANRQGIGSRITLRYRGQSTQLCEISAGNGYLSQSPNEIFTSETKNNPIEQATVRWPDGTQSSHVPPQTPGSQLWELRYDTAKAK